MFSVQVRPHLFLASFHVMLVIGSFVVSLVSGPNQFSPRPCSYLWNEFLVRLLAGEGKRDLMGNQ